MKKILPTLSTLVATLALATSSAATPTVPDVPHPVAGVFRGNTAADPTLIFNHIDLGGNTQAAVDTALQKLHDDYVVFKQDAATTGSAALLQGNGGLYHVFRGVNGFDSAGIQDCIATGQFGSSIELASNKGFSALQVDSYGSPIPFHGTRAQHNATLASLGWPMMLASVFRNTAGKCSGLTTYATRDKSGPHAPVTIGGARGPVDGMPSVTVDATSALLVSPIIDPIQITEFPVTNMQAEPNLSRIKIQIDPVQFNALSNNSRKFYTSRVFLMLHNLGLNVSINDSIRDNQRRFTSIMPHDWSDLQGTFNAKKADSPIVNGAPCVICGTSTASAGWPVTK
jgi:hypothetical protein